MSWRSMPHLPGEGFRSVRALWKFKSKDDVAEYESWRRPLWRDVVVGLVVAAPPCVFVVSIYGTWSTWFPIMCLLAIVWMPGLRLRYRIDYGLEGVEVVLHEKSFDFIERFSRVSMSIRVARVYARTIKAARWASEGLQFDVRPSLQRQVVLSYRFLFESSGTEKVLDWCKANKIEVEGVPALREGYVRHIDERRGL